MKQITEKQYLALTDSIYKSLMNNPDFGMGEMGDCRDESIRIVDEWMNENGIEWENNEGQQQPVQGEGFTGGEWKIEHDPYFKLWDIVSGKTGIARIAAINHPNKKEAEANAALISNSKSMFYLLQQFVDYLDSDLSEAENILKNRAIELINKITQP